MFSAFAADQERAGGGESAGGGGERAQEPGAGGRASQTPPLVFPETPDFPSWNDLSQSTDDTGRAWMGAWASPEEVMGVGAGEVGGGGTGGWDAAAAALSISFIYIVYWN